MFVVVIVTQSKLRNLLETTVITTTALLTVTTKKGKIGDLDTIGIRSTNQAKITLIYSSSGMIMCLFHTFMFSDDKIYVIVEHAIEWVDD